MTDAFKRMLTEHADVVIENVTDGERLYRHRSQHIPYVIAGYEIVTIDLLPDELRSHVEHFMTLDAVPTATMSPGFIADLATFGTAPRDYGTPDGARLQCGFATSGFLSLLVNAGYIDRGFPGIRWWNTEAAVINGMDHRAAQVDEFIIDFTARQFDASAPWPLVWKQLLDTTPEAEEGPST